MTKHEIQAYNYIKKYYDKELSEYFNDINKKLIIDTLIYMTTNIKLGVNYTQLNQIYETIIKNYQWINCIIDKYNNHSAKSLSTLINSLHDEYKPDKNNYKYNGTLLSTEYPETIKYIMPNIDNNTIETITNATSNKDNYEYVNHPTHYNQWKKEVIDMMIDIYGKENTALFCEMNAFKYTMRVGFKPTDNIKQDIDKRNWYLKKKSEILNSIK